MISGLWRICGIMEMSFARVVGFKERDSLPFSFIVPEYGIIPDKARRSVDLPHPFLPSMTVISLGHAENETECRISFLPYFTLKFLHSIILFTLSE